jgi:hypothetical protein
VEGSDAEEFRGGPANGCRSVTNATGRGLAQAVVPSLGERRKAARRQRQEQSTLRQIALRIYAILAGKMTGKTRKLGRGAMSRTDVWYMVRSRAADAGIETAIGCHTFRSTGITDYLTNGGTYRSGATDGRPFERENHRALRPAQR